MKTLENEKTKLNKIVKILFSFILLLYGNWGVSQSMLNYSLSTATNGSLVLDRNSNAVDMSSGTTLLRDANLDDSRAQWQTMPFDFYFWGTLRTSFGVNTNGIFSFDGGLAAAATQLQINNEVFAAPFAGNLATSATGKVHYKVVGSSPNRCMVVEWLNMEVSNASSTADATFQLRLYETTGIIEFVYGSMNVGVGGGTNDYQIGIQRDDNDNRYLSVNANTLAEVRTGGAYNNSYGVGDITDLHSAADGSRVLYTFTAFTSVPATPTAAATTFDNIGCNSIDFHWADNSTTESFFDIYVSTDNSYFEYLGATQSTTTAATGTEYSYSATNLSPSQNYYFRAVARNESNAPSGNYDAGPQATGGAGATITSTQTGDWNDGTTWVGGVVPTSCNDVVIANGHTITINSTVTTPAICSNLTIQNGGILQYPATRDRYMYVGGDVTVDNGGQFNGNSEAGRNSYLYISGNLIVNGTFDMVGADRATTVYFENEFDATVTGTGATCRFYILNVNKGNTPTGYLVDVQRAISFYSPSAAYRGLYAQNGTLKISSNCGAIAPFYNSQTICSSTGKFHIDNAGTTINWANSGAYNATFSGDFEINNGTFNAQQNIAVSGILIMSSGTLTTVSGDLNLANGSNGTISGGTVTLGDDLLIYDDLTVSGSATSITCDDVTIGNNGTTQLGTLTWTDADLTVTDDFTMNGPSTISGADATIAIGDDIIINNNQLTGGSNGTLAVTNSTITGDAFTVSGTTTFSGSSSITLSGNLSIYENADNSTNGSFVYTSTGASTCNEIYIEGLMQIDSGSIAAGARVRVYDNTTTDNGVLTINGGSLSTTSTFESRGVTTLNNNASLSADGAFTIYGYGGYTGAVQMNNASTVIAEANMTSNGDLTMTGSSECTVGDGNDLFFAERDATVTLNSTAILNVFGRVNFSDDNGISTLVMADNSEINIDPQHTSTAAADELLEMENNSVANCTGGTITFIDPNPNNTSRDVNTFEIHGTSANMNFLGVTVQFGDGVSSSSGNADPNYKGFKLRSYNEVITLGDIIINNPGGTNREVSINTENAGDNYDFICNNLTITAGTFDITRRKLTVNENISNTGSLLSLAGSTGEISFNGTSAQTYSGTGSYSLENLTVNNTSVTGVTLNNDFGGEWVNLTDGHVYTSSTNYLTVYGTTPANLSGGSTASYVQGNLRRAIPNNAGTDDYNFPVGKTNYRLLEMQGITTSGTGTGYIAANVFEGVDMNGKAAGSGLANPTIAENIYWQISPAMASVSLDAVSSVRLTYTDPPVTPPRTIGQSNNNIDGSYLGIGRVVGAGTLQSESFDLTGISPTGDAYLIISEVEPLEGTYYVGTFDGGIDPDASRFYQSLTTVAAELRVKYVNDDVNFEILSTYDDDNETIPINFDKLMLTDPAHSVSIYPRTGVTGIETVQAGTSNAMITMDNIHELTFDGRPNMAGTTSEWTIGNIDGTPGPVFELRNDASNNTLTYLSIKSDVASSSNGVITIGTTTESDGNDNNTINNCDITGYSSTTTIGVYSAGTSGASNSGNTIDNCNIYDYFNATTNTSGIHLANDNDNWTISNNRMYQTASRTFTTGNIYSGVWVESGTNHTINSNTLGYNNSSATGFTNIDGSATTSEFCGIYMNVGNGTASNITNNLISGIQFSSSNLNAGNGLFNGIYVDAGDVNIGTTGNGNTIGTTGNFVTYPIQITTAANNGRIIPIYVDAPRPVSMIDNNIGGIQISGDYNQYFMGFQTTSTSGNADYTIRGNTIGSITQANSIYLPGTVGWNWVLGIYIYQSDDIIIDDNIIANITSESTDNNGNNRMSGIYSNDADVNTITDNQIYKFTNSSGNQYTDYRASLSGIIKRSQDATDQTISGNTIYELINLDAGDRALRIIGIHTRSNAAANDDISANFIHSLNSESINAVHYGIYLENGGSTLANNMLQLGIDEAGNSITEQITLYGIANLSDDPSNFYHNSIYIGGTGVTDGADGAGKNSYAFYQTEDAIVNIKNNIFNNVRSTTSAVYSKHYAMSLTYKDNVSSDYNIFNASGTGGVFSILDDNPQATLQAHRYYFSNMDLYSGYGIPNFVAPTGTSTTCNLHVQGNTSTFDMCKVIATVTTDYDGTSRGSEGDATCIGADDGAYAITNAEDIFTPNFNYTPIVNQTPLTDGVVDVTITDQAPTGQGVDQTNVPRIYFRRGDSDTPANIEAWDINRFYDGDLQGGGNGENGVWRFTIEGNGGAFYTDLADNDIIEYFIVAQDQANSLNVWYSKFGATTPVFNDVTTINPSPDKWPDGTVDVDFYGIGGNLNGTYTIGTDPTDDFSSLTGSKGFFQNISALNHTGDIVAIIQEDITEPATYACGEWAEVPSSSGYYVTISTGGAYKLDCTANRDMIRLEGADRVIFDGNIDGTGRNLTIEHLNINYSVITFTDDAKNNLVKNCNIYGSPRLRPIGIVHFGETTGADGNDDNTIQNNLIWNISGNIPDNAVYSRGNIDDVVTNSGNTISENDIKNCNFTGIWVTSTGNGNGWTIADNTLYYDYTAKSTEEQAGIRVEQGEGHSITGNWIGGSSPTLPTSSWENTGQNDFYGIYMSVGSGTLSTVSGNTIHNIHKSNTAGGPNEFRGIYSVAGLVNVTGNYIYNIINDGRDYTRMVYIVGASGINVSNNTISDITTNGNQDFITFYLDVTNGSNPDPTINQFQNNVINGITINNTGTGIDFYGLWNQNGNFNITGNIIGGNNASDKITFNGGNVFRGFYINGSDFNQSFNSNQIQNIEITSNNQFRGLFLENSDDNVDINIQNNVIENLTLNCNTEVIGMQINDGRVLLSNNTFGTSTYGISNSGTGNMRGFYLTPSDNNFVVENNTVTNIDNAAAIQAFYIDENRPYQVNNNTINGINTANDIAFTGINITAANNAFLDGNKIEDIIMANTGSNTSFKGIWVSAATNLTMGTSTANTIGHTSTANSISVAGPNLTGISLTGTSVVYASNNLIANLTSTSTDVAAYIKGLEVDGTGVKTVSSNTIRDITTTSTKTDITDGVLASQGVWVGGSSASSIASNTIYNITASGTANINVAAISENATDATITKNKIYDISNTTTGSGTVSGIVLYNLNAGYIANNMISIGEADATEYSGIWIPQNNANTKNIYFNSVCILDGPTGNSYAFLRENNTSPLNVKNNIFSNFATAGNRYAVASRNISGLTNSTINSNCYFSLNSATIGLWGAADNDFDTWISNTGEDNENLSTDEQPSFVDATNCNLHLSDYNNACPFNSAGELIADVTDDWDGDARDANNPDIGADEFTPTGHNGDYVWRGWTDTDWATASNWQCGFAPSSSPGQTIVVTEGGNHAEIGNDFTADDLEVRNNGTLNVTAGNLLTVDGIFTNATGGSVIVSSSAYLTTNQNFNNRGEFRLNCASDNNQSGSYIDASGTYSNIDAGTFNIERFFIQKEFHYFGIPIQAGGNANSDLFCTSANGNFNANLYTYDETVDLSSSPNPFDNNWLTEGWAFVRANEAAPDVNLTKDFGYAFYDESDKLVTFTGTPNTGDLDVIGLSYTDDNDDDNGDPYNGWHLVSNPYPSSIDWDAIDDNLTNLDNAIYVWEGDNITGAYASYVGGSAGGTGNLDRYIATGQSFFVHATADNAGFQLRNTHRVHSGVKFLKSSSINNLLKLNVIKEGLSTKTVVYFNQNATNEFDGEFDAYQLFAPWSRAPQIYSITTGNKTKLSISTLPETEMENTSVPLGIMSVDGGNSVINLEEFNGFDLIHVYLEDLDLNEMKNLRNISGYNFNLTPGYVSDRFVLHFTENNTPVLENPFGKQYAEQDAAFNWGFADNVFTDPDIGDNISYTVKLANGQDLPSWLTFDSASRTFSGIPENADVGIISLQLKATDMLAAVNTYNFDIEVQNVNDPPFLQNSFTDKNTQEDQNFAFTFSTNMFIDIDQGDQLSYDAKLTNGNNLPGWLSFNSLTRTFSGIPGNDDVGIMLISITATDNYGEYVSDEFTIEVQNVNDAPEVQNTIEDQNILLGTDYLYYVPENTFNDIDKGDELTLSAKLDNGESLPGWLSFDNIIGTFSGIAEQIGEHSIELTATDKSGVSVSTIFKLSVYSTTDIEKLGEKVLSVYPNPSNGRFFVSIDIHRFNADWDLFIKDINGKHVFKGKMDSGKKFIDMNGVSPGTYFIEIGNDKNRIIKSIIIEE